MRRRLVRNSIFSFNLGHVHFVHFAGHFNVDILDMSTVLGERTLKLKKRKKYKSDHSLSLLGQIWTIFQR